MDNTNKTFSEIVFFASGDHPFRSGAVVEGHQPGPWEGADEEDAFRHYLTESGSDRTVDDYQIDERDGVIRVALVPARERGIED